MVTGAEVLDILLRWALPSLCAAVAGWAVAAVRAARTAQRAEADESDAVRLGVQALLRDRIYWAHDHYIERGELPIYARENLDNMYAQYHALGGNGAMTDLVRELEALPTNKKAAL